MNSVPKMSYADIGLFYSQVEKQLFGHLIPFWSTTAVDAKEGGWMAWLSNDLTPDRTKPKGLIVHSRILWAFSAVHQAKPEPSYKKMAERAYEYLVNKFWDARHGGAFWRLNDNGTVSDDSKKIYGQAFYIYAMSEYYRAFKHPQALDKAKELFELIESHAHDPRNGGYVEVCRRDWSEAGPEARLSEKDMSEKKSMNNHLHVLEAYTNLHRVWPDKRVSQRLTELINIFLDRILDAKTSHFHHFFDEKWNVRSDTCTYGHDIEGSWLLCEAAHELGDKPLIQRVEQVALKMAAVIMDEGFGVDGGLCYEGRDGRVIDPGRECWPQAEAVVGFLNAFEISGNSTYFAAAAQVWDYIETHLVDHKHGEWFWRINEDGKPDPQLPKVSEWKGPYHGSRACLEALTRLNKILALVKQKESK